MNDGNSNLDSLISFYLIISIVGVKYYSKIYVYFKVDSCCITLTDKYAISLKFFYPLVKKNLI